MIFPKRTECATCASMSNGREKDELVVSFLKNVGQGTITPRGGGTGVCRLVEDNIVLIVATWYL